LKILQGNGRLQQNDVTGPQEDRMTRFISKLRSGLAMCTFEKMFGILRAVLWAAALLVPGFAAEPTPGYGLIAHWAFDEDLTSSVNNSLYAATASAPEFIAVDRAAGSARMGGGALRSNTGARSGNRAFLSVESPLFGATGNDVLTVTGWFKVQDIAADGMDARNTFWESTPTSSLSFGVVGAPGEKKTYFRIRTEAYAVFEQAAGPVVEMGKWHHVALIWNSPAGHVRLYLQGQLVKELAVPGKPPIEPMRGIHVGARKVADGQADWDGWLDDLAVFDVELSSRQIQALAAGRHQNREVSARTLLEVLPEPTLQTIVARPSVAVAQYPASETVKQGPFLGHVDDDDAVVWARLPAGGRHGATATSRDGAHRVSASGDAVEANDWCVHWRFASLRPAMSYRITFPEAVGLEPIELRTAGPPATPARVTLAFGSCASFADSSIWTRMAAECPDGMVLLGDTPYIDSTELRWQRWAYRRFASVPQFAGASRRIPVWGTWDDHDFGKDAADGTLPGKDQVRKAFLEYRSNADAGTGADGIYTRFRRGPVEVFLLDTRWFAKTEPSWANPARPTLLGRKQWEWLQAGLLASDAPFKILASGMIWDVKGKAGDAWGAYQYERDALEQWLGEKQIPGVILMGGDIHVSRLLKYPTRERVGYDLFQFIVSPLSDRVLPDANVPNPNLVASAVEPFVFLKLTADSTTSVPTLKAEWINRDGRQIFQQELNANELKRH
jgi:alkaline phosphatase D